MKTKETPTETANRLEAMAQIALDLGDHEMADVYMSGAHAIRHLRTLCDSAMQLPKLYAKIHTIDNAMRKCVERRRTLDGGYDGNFGIAVANDADAVEWQKLDHEREAIEQNIDTIIRAWEDTRLKLGGGA